jgi:hypothetical protein
MSLTSDFFFNKMARIGNDTCDISQKNIQSVNNANYMLENYYPSCPMSSAIDFATSQPNIFYNGSQQVGIGGCNIDENSELLLTDLSRPKCRVSLFERPFLTVPYLGRGPSNIVLESQIQQGNTNINRKSISTTSETSHFSHHAYPLIPQIKATISNPANLVEGEAAEGWIRGGLPSRDLQRDQDYKTVHTPGQY